MFNIDRFLDKFYKDVKKTDLYKEKVLFVLEKYTNTKLSSNNIELKNYTLFIKTSPGILNKVFIYKKAILEEIFLIGDGLKITEIRKG